MNLLRMSALTALLLFGSTLVMAAADPVIHVDDPAGSFAPVGLSFSFASDGSGGGVSMFTNTSGVTFTTLEVNVAAPQPAGAITCDGTAFTHCFRQWFTEAGFATIDFYGGPGIANGASFQIDLGTTGWTPNATFTAFANETDEPEPTPD